MKLRGIIPPLVTPLHDDETVHEDQLRRVTEYLLNAGVHEGVPPALVCSFTLVNRHKKLSTMAS